MRRRLLCPPLFSPASAAAAAASPDCGGGLLRCPLFARGPPNAKQAFGPAFLVYYSPAFLRNLSPADALPALRILAEVYRRARQLWPLR